MYKSREEHEKTIKEMIDAMSSARILAGAEFESLCNEGKNIHAEIFCMTREVLRAQITIINDYLILLQKENNDV